MLWRSKKFHVDGLFFFFPSFPPFCIVATVNLLVSAVLPISSIAKGKQCLSSKPVFFLFFPFFLFLFFFFFSLFFLFPFTCATSSKKEREKKKKERTSYPGRFSWFNYFLFHVPSRYIYVCMCFSYHHYIRPVLFTTRKTKGKKKKRVCFKSPSLLCPRR